MGKLASNSLDLNPVDFQCGEHCNRWLSSQNFRHGPAEMHANRLLDSSKPGHIELSDQSAARMTDDRQMVPILNFFGQIQCEDNCCCYFYRVFELKIGKIHAFSEIQHKFTCSGVLCKLSKEYLHALTCKFYTFFYTKF